MLESDTYFFSVISSNWNKFESYCCVFVRGGYDYIIGIALRPWYVKSSYLFNILFIFYRNNPENKLAIFVCLWVILQATHCFPMQGTNMLICNDSNWLCGWGANGLSLIVSYVWHATHENRHIILICENCTNSESLREKYFSRTRLHTG